MFPFSSRSEFPFFKLSQLMKYNTQKPALIFSEYGRGIQNMVEHAVTIPTRSGRDRAAQTILRFMLILNPQIKELDDYMHKLYDQLIIMSDFKLDITNPYPNPEPQSENTPVKPVYYHPANIRFRYYGKTLEAMIKKAADMPDGPEKIAALNLITVQMKKSYYLWNADILSDELVAEHLKILTNGKLTYTDEMKAEVYSTFYNKPSLEKKHKFINVSAYDNSNRKNFVQHPNNRNNNNVNIHKFYTNKDDNGFSPNNPSRFKKRRPF